MGAASGAIGARSLSVDRYLYCRWLGLLVGWPGKSEGLAIVSLQADWRAAPYARRSITNLPTG